MCTPLTLTLAILTPENDKQISFGLTHTCNSNGSDSWEIDFTYKEQVNGTWVALITLNLNVNPQAAKAQNAANSGLTSNQLLYLQGPVYNKAKQVAALTNSAPPVSEFMKNLTKGKVPSFAADDMKSIAAYAADLAAQNDQLNVMVISTLSVQ